MVPRSITRPQRLVALGEPNTPISNGFREPLMERSSRTPPQVVNSVHTGDDLDRIVGRRRPSSEGKMVMAAKRVGNYPYDVSNRHTGPGPYIEWPCRLGLQQCNEGVGDVRDEHKISNLIPLAQRHALISEQASNYRRDETIRCLARSVGKEDARPSGTPAVEICRGSPGQAHRELALPVDSRRPKRRSCFVAGALAPIVFCASTDTDRAAAATFVKVSRQGDPALKPAEIGWACPELTRHRDPGEMEKMSWLYICDQLANRTGIEKIDAVPLDPGAVRRT